MKVEHDYPVPKLAPGGVLVKNKYSGINFIDTYHRSGLYKRELPFIGGQEGGGFVAAVTPEAEAQGVKVGDRVAYSSVFQTYAEYTAVPGNKVVTVPEEVPLDVAVSCGVQGMTAHYLTHSAHAGLVKPGEWMLIHGTGSGTCQWAAQMAKLRGYKVIGTCSESKQDIARATGVDELIVYKEAPGTSYEDYSSVDLVPKVMEITGGEGVKAVIDGIGLATWETSIEVLARRGIFVSFGNASGAVPAFPPLRFINKSGFLTRPKLNDYTVTREELLSRANDIYGWINSGDLKVAVRAGEKKNKKPPLPFSLFVARLTRAVADETNPRLQSWSPHAHRPHIKQSFEAPREARVLDESALGSRRRSPEKDPAPLTAAPNPEPKRPVRPRRSTGASPWSRPWRVTITSRLVSLAARCSTRSDRRDIENDRLFARRSPRDSACLLYTSPSPREQRGSRMPSSA